MSNQIRAVYGYRILDSRNNPTVACRMVLSDGKSVVFKVPSGASTGEKEAVELRDGGNHWRGKDVSRAAAHVEALGKRLCGMDVEGVPQSEIDGILKSSDGTPNLSRYGANAVLAVSGAFLLAKAESMKLELWQLFNPASDNRGLWFPVPMLNVLNAGRHADSGFEVQETMVVPAGARSFADAMEMSTDVWYRLKSMLKANGHSTGRGDEGGFVNPFRSIEETLDNVLQAITKAGYSAGKQIFVAFDAAFSEIYGKDLMQDERNPEDGTYHFNGKRISSEELVRLWAGVSAKYPQLISLEDGMAELDPTGWKLLTAALSDRVQLVLDDYICTNPGIITQAIADGIGNAHLIKVNQVGTISDTLQAMELGYAAGRPNVISHRSGETEDSLIAHLALHPLSKQLKSGSSGADRNAKYNLLLMAEEDFHQVSRYYGIDAFPSQVVLRLGNEAAP